MIIIKPNILTGTRTQGCFRVCGPLSYNLFAETNNFGPASVLLSCLASELQKPPSPVLELSVRRSKISVWFREISLPSFRQTDVSILELQANIRTDSFNLAGLYKTEIVSVCFFVSL
jgi:hypothetical protein